jgi:diguanylate cyclase (GGDEF)-like protein
VTIRKKMLLGYLPLSALIILIAVLSLVYVGRMRGINETVITRDLRLVDATEKMLDSLLAQELYASRFAILRNPEMLTTFWERSADFEHRLKALKELPGGDIPVRHISDLHAEYNAHFVDAIGTFGAEGRGEKAAEHERLMKKTQEELIHLLKDVNLTARLSQNSKTRETARIGGLALRVMSVLSVLGILVGVGSAALITRGIVRSVRVLREATNRVAQGRFEQVPQVHGSDELGELSRAFGEMARRLKALEEMYLDTSPLTRLPGGIAIENVLKKRIEGGGPLAFCLLDLDDFKAFNDRYGYARGSELIKGMAQIIEEVVDELGSDDDFVGHIGGDDYVIITDREHYGRLCAAVIQRFDASIAEHYDPLDRERGFIISKTRQGQRLAFPLMSVSIAVVTNKVHKLVNHIQVGEIAAELKEYAKSIPGSIYVVDRRREDAKTGVKEVP